MSQWLTVNNQKTIIVDLKKHQHAPLNAKLMLNSAHFMKTCALNHMGIIQLHDYMIENELKSGQLIEILQKHIKPAIPIYVYYQKHRLIQPKIKQFIELIFDLI